MMWCWCRLFIFTCFLVIVDAEDDDKTAVRHCNRQFDWINRTDESFENCRWLDSVNTNGKYLVLGASQVDLVPDLSDCEAGVECGGECVGLSVWCHPLTGAGHRTRCGALLHSPSICTNQTFWSSKTCDHGHKRWV